MVDKFHEIDAEFRLYGNSVKICVPEKSPLNSVITPLICILSILLTGTTVKVSGLFTPNEVAESHFAQQTLELKSTLTVFELETTVMPPS